PDPGPEGATGPPPLGGAPGQPIRLQPARGPSSYGARSSRWGCDYKPEALVTPREAYRRVKRVDTSGALEPLRSKGVTARFRRPSRVRRQRRRGPASASAETVNPRLMCSTSWPFGELVDSRPPARRRRSWATAPANMSTSWSPSVERESCDVAVTSEPQWSR